MQFNQETNGLDLYTDCLYWTGATSTDYPIKDFTRNANFALDRINALILKADGQWKYDDTNQAGELFDVSNNIVSGTQKTALGVTWLKINEVRIKDQNGNWKILPRLDRKKETDSQLTATSGLPSSYFVIGNYLYFDKAPNYSSTSGLEVQYQRGAAYFVYTDTTKSPGFAAQFHRLISLHAALDFCSSNEMAGRAAIIQAKIGTPPDLMNNQAGSGLEKELVDFYSQRDADEQPSISFKRNDYGESALRNGPFSNNPYGF